MIYSAATKLIWLLNLLIRLFPQFSPISNWTENTRKLVEGRFICRKCLMDLTRVDAGGLMDTGLMELSGGVRRASAKWRRRNKWWRENLDPSIHCTMHTWEIHFEIQSQIRQSKHCKTAPGSLSVQGVPTLSLPLRPPWTKMLWRCLFAEKGIFLPTTLIALWRQN